MFWRRVAWSLRARPESWRRNRPSGRRIWGSRERSVLPVPDESFVVGQDEQEEESGQAEQADEAEDGGIALLLGVVPAAEDEGEGTERDEAPADLPGQAARDAP